MMHLESFKVTVILKLLKILTTISTSSSKIRTLKKRGTLMKGSLYQLTNKRELRPEKLIWATKLLK
jgi:hypothetical protein